LSSFVRRFTFDPGNDVLLNIESVNILDLEPPSALKGIGTGTVMMVGEFENGPYNFPLEVSSADDLTNNFGTLGYTYFGVQAQNPCAIARKADGAGAVEYWNGNGFVQLQGKQYARLIICRVNTSVGNVQFTKLPYVTGLPGLQFSLQPGQVVQLDIGAGPTNATFNATAASVTSSGATYAVNPGDQVVLGVDGRPNFTVTFLTGDGSQAGVIARINATAGFTLAATSSGQFSLTGLQRGNQAQVRVVSFSSGGVGTALGLTAGTTLGTGNVANIASVSQSEVTAVIQTAIANTRVEFDSSSRLRISNTSPTTAPYILVGSGTTATAFGLTAGTINTQQGQAIVVGTAVTLPPTAASTITLGIDAQPNVTVTFAGTETTVALVVTAINNAFTAAGQPAVAFADGAANLYLTSALTGTTAAQVRVVAVSAQAVLTKLGLVLGTTVGAPFPLGVLAAGTIVQVPGSAGPVYVTAQDVNFTTVGVLIGGKTSGSGGVAVPNAGPFTVPVRPALDDGSVGAATAGAVTQITNAPDIGSFSVQNLQPISAALSESAIDAAYVTALGQPSMDINTVAKQVNIVLSARQSNTVRRGLRTNALTASASGCFGRMACVRPPLNTDKYTATSPVADPGVGAYRDQRVVYCYIGTNVYVPLIARLGLAGNPPNTGYTAFTVDGNIDVGSDSLMASIMSQLPPEENPGQETSFASIVNGIEKGANVQGFQMADYQLFKASGIAALRIDDGNASFQSGVTAVDPNVNPSLVRIARRRMADYIQDSIAQRGKAYSKRLMTVNRRNAFAQEIKAFMEGLLSANNPSFQRIGGFTLDAKKGNTTRTLQQGINRVILRVQTLPSMDSIVLETTIGDQVTVQESLPQAA